MSTAATGRYELRLAGKGGQGIVLAGLLLAEAAILAGKHATHAQTYGPESRGGASKADVIISDGPIDYLWPSELDALVALSQEGWDRNSRQVRHGGLVVVDSENVACPGGVDVEQCAFPITAIAKQRLGTAVGANVVALGVLVALSHVVPVEAAEQAIAARRPGGSAEPSLRAFRAGLDLVETAVGKGPRR